MTLKNAYNVRPDEIQPGDEFCFVVKLMIGRKDINGRLIYRVYRCPFEDDEAPQGERVDSKLESTVMKALFPVVKWANGKADLT